MKKNLLWIFGMLMMAHSQAQTNWSEHIAPILFDHCTKCHHPGGIGPSSYMTYDDAYNNSGSILAAITEGIMPPWPADPNYRHFANENVLTATEKNLINDWVMGGAIQGDINLAPTPPNYTSSSALPQVDFTGITPLYTSQAVTHDDYRTFVVPSNYSVDQFIDAIEIIPGNMNIVHHVVIYYDPTNTCLSYDAADTEPGFATNGTGGGIPPAAHFLAAWVPGKGPQFVPQGFGLRAEANGYYLIEMHYPAGSVGQTDETTINLHHSTATSPREVFFEPVITHFPNTLDEAALVIPANTEATFHATYNLNAHVTLFGVFPHMHLIGKSIRSFAVNNNDTIPLVSIPNWDFQWQLGYDYPQLLHLTPGTAIKAVATYDNTLNNPNQPNNPPLLVTAGEETADEMLIIFFMYSAYQPGDENIVVDPNLFVQDTPFIPQLPVKTFPNPAMHELQIQFTAEQSEWTTLYMTDMNGKIRHKESVMLLPGINNKTLDIQTLSAGIYELSFMTKNGIAKTKFVKH
jgi:Secretion system C-terminal sorting domain/Copper type II ascorbate-dependent monooxygenase, C-terminal domain